MIEYYQRCTEKSFLVADYVTFHIFFPMDHMPANLTVAFSCNDLLEDPVEWTSYRAEQKLDYPINVARMIARESATTHYIFASDIELYPSPKLIPMFLSMIRSAQIPSKTVFVTPIFEIAANQNLPKSKKELVFMIDTKVAIVFHQNFCPECHTVPCFQEWLLDASIEGNLEVSYENMPMIIFARCR